MISLFNILSNFCDSDVAYRIVHFLGVVFNIAKIVVPIIIILYGSIDLIKGVINPDSDKNIKLFIKRIIYGVLFFFVTYIVTFIFSFTNNKLDNKCLEIFLEPDNPILGVTDVVEIKDKNECEKLGDPYIWIDDDCKIDISKDKVGE